jgi:hypothetical protein
MQEDAHPVIQFTACQRSNPHLSSPPSASSRVDFLRRLCSYHEFSLGERHLMSYIVVLLLGIFFGMLLTNGELVSWFRIQEMFRFDAFHMYGVFGSAVVVGALSMWILKKVQAHAIGGERIVIEKKAMEKGTVIGGFLFGVGWALTGACPGPLYALVGSGYAAFLVALLSAIGGALVYGLLRDKLPH